MKIVWEGAIPLGDAEAVAALCKVSVRSVRRHCTPARRQEPAGPGTVQAYYNLDTARTVLADVKTRKKR